jgi:ATP-binding cassette, subfamily B, bacterial
MRQDSCQTRTLFVIYSNMKNEEGPEGTLLKEDQATTTSGGMESNTPVGSLLNEGQTTMFRMRGGSMYPSLRDGDMAIVESCDTDRLKPGDIVVFSNSRNYLAHRLVRLERHGQSMVFTAKGDKNPSCDAPFKVDSLCGVITRFTRGNAIKTVNDADSRWYRFFATHFQSLSFHCWDLDFRVRNRMNGLQKNAGGFRKNWWIFGKSSRKPFWTNAVLSVLQGIAPFLLILCIKLLIDMLVSPAYPTNSASGLTFPGRAVLDAVTSGTSIWTEPSLLIAVTALVFLLVGFLTVVQPYFFEKLAHAVTKNVYGLMHEKHRQMELSYYEDSTWQDKLFRAEQEAHYRPVRIMSGLLSLCRSATSVIFIFLLILSIHWTLLVLLMIAVLPTVWVRQKFNGRRYKQKESHSTKEREMAYYNRILTAFPYAKELRLFGFSSIFKDRFQKMQETLHAEKQDLRRSEMKSNLFAQIFAVLLIVASISVVIGLLFKGMLSIGTVTMFFFVFQRGYSVLNELLHSLSQLAEDNLFFNDLTTFLQIPVKEQINGGRPMQSLKKGISVDGLRFRYENSKREALSDINLFIPAGKTVAIVGGNGSGKTTLVKLLCGFYEPNEGSIRYDDEDLARIDKKSLQKSITAVFQDYALYNLSARENIMLGDIDHPFDTNKAEAAARAAGIYELFERLPQGFETLLGSLFRSGEELSIGQWQKIAIARAFYRDSPILFMDEPSSALDVDSEQQLLKSLRTLAMDKTVLIISHRLSTVQWADIIYVMDKGQIVESGSHEELMVREGIYCSMYLSSRGEVDKEDQVHLRK